MPKNKITLSIIGVIILLFILGGGYFLFTRQSASKPPADKNQSVIDNGPEDLSPGDIGLTLTASQNKKQVKFSIDKLSGIKAVAYQITYEADSTKQEISEGGDPKIQRGIIGDVKFKSGDSSYESPWIDLGSASKNVVRYDSGVDSVTILLKITKDNNKVFQVEDKLNL
ncbi:hypothetical protein KJ980_02590 [Patescibacteria group bacterium]|nr:hypothetical protein [Patescibacteria group bacterium]MBU4016747.1 hypothetical protein [Patescibacteria group bacterium]MBU4098517.1 hypothetical protein [Patescibacteria group bacterium]